MGESTAEAAFSGKIALFDICIYASSMRTMLPVLRSGVCILGGGGTTGYKRLSSSTCLGCSGDPFFVVEAAEDISLVFPEFGRSTIPPGGGIRRLIISAFGVPSIGLTGTLTFFF